MPFNLEKNEKCCKEFHELLNQVKKKPIEPLNFLSHVLNEINDDEEIHSKAKHTNIDSQLASLIKRIEMNVSILERTNQRVKDINFIVEKNKILASRELNYDKETLSQMNEEGFKTISNIEHPEIDKVHHMMNNTLQVLKCIKKVTMSDLDLDLDLDFNKLDLKSNSKHTELK